MPEIEIYQRYYPPINYEEMTINLSERDFSHNLTAKDRRRIEYEWQTALKEKPRIFSIPRGLATLNDTQDGILKLDITDFKTYLAISRTHKKPNSLSAKIYGSMRIAAVGAAVYLDDGGIFIHKRAKNATHVPNSWDSSVAGLVDIQKAKGINFLYALYEKLQRELNFSQEEIKASEIKVTGVHSSREPDFSGTIDFLVRAPVKRLVLENRIKRSKEFEEYTIIGEQELPNFILSHYAGSKVCLEGCATLLLSLPSKPYKKTLQDLKRRGRQIEYGLLRNGDFIHL